MSEELFVWQQEQIELETSTTDRASESFASIDLADIDQVLVDRLQLCLLPGLGPRSLSVLLQAFGSADAVLRASSADLQRVPGVGPKLAHTITTASDHVDVQRVLSWCRDNHVEILEPDRPGFPCRSPYPTPLLELDDTPPLLFASGQWRASDEFAIAIVGTRHATPYGLQQTRNLVRDLAAASVTIVSGLARGIDTAAHRAAIEVGGRTIAFLGGGLGEMYPAENAGLAKEIRDHGAVISEYSPLAKPRSGMFPQRNRLIAAASLATLVIEAPMRSGSLITARLASEMGRSVGALPGPVNSRASSGCHHLIRDGGTLVTNADDVLELLGPVSQPIVTTAGRVGSDSRYGDIGEGVPESALNRSEREIRNGVELSLNEIERSILDHISPTGTAIDEIIAKTELSSPRVTSIISVLEMKRLVRRLSSQYVSRI
ncbi:DNA-processing protein DprA [Neorhodopirellula pilleata]|uniref:DNA-processing protein DprA n=1 Tax=Neorhodopirellula pilleata TaxID=2714738 RepID=UPI001E4F0B06|nr:DNA-processing protein DprA [Neorhodopirellula pilleata]